MMSVFVCDLPHHFEQVVVTHKGVKKDNQRTFKVNMVIADQSASFMTTVISTFVGKIIGYRLSDSHEAGRLFARVISVDAQKGKVEICPVSFQNTRTKEKPVITDQQKRATKLTIADITDLVTLGESNTESVKA